MLKYKNWSFMEQAINFPSLIAVDVANIIEQLTLA